MLKKILKRFCFYRSDNNHEVGNSVIPDMNFLRRVAMKEAIYNVSTAVRYEPDALAREKSLRGDYLEFGVYEGQMFRFAYKEAAERMPWMRFIACDSFQGLPKPKGIDSGGEFLEGQFACSREQFLSRLKNESISLEKIMIIPGWFSDSLQEQNIAKLDIKTVSIAYVDCDLYESCVPVLSFLTTRLRQGSVVMFDDWFCFRADPRKGIQLAVNEWLNRNPHIELIPWRSFSSHGLGFFVNLR
jgi:O-methyltransferase